MSYPVDMDEKAAWRGFSVEHSVRRKMGENRERERLHGRTF